MEEEDRRNPGETANKTLDPISNKKHLAMIERLSNHHQSRINQSLSRKSDSDTSTRSFLNRFSQSKQSIESELDRCRQLSISDPEAKFHLDKVSLLISDLEKLVAENSYFLPPYEVRSSLKSISDLKESLEIVSSKVLPKKKFAFRNKSATKKENQTNEVKVSKIEKTSLLVKDSPGFRSKEGEILVRDFSGLEMGEFMLSDLNSCEIRLMGCLRALFIHRLRNCKVFVGPVMGSILIEEVENCLFVLASHQIRIHHAKGTDFYLRVRSRPIIEDSNGVRFAPYCLSYDGVEKELKDSSLDEETGNWANVDDFKWLRAMQSPNWCILPESERVGAIVIPKPEKETCSESCLDSSFLSIEAEASAFWDEEKDSDSVNLHFALCRCSVNSRRYLAFVTIRIPLVSFYEDGCRHVKVQTSRVERALECSILAKSRFNELEFEQEPARA
ncbi:Tubulin binding cofactor C-like domain [Dillenia turbinata]|uniref:Tubulin binding cofactor C-like domain n=1 Tax=Dillenia turbinata TaxID=194707 RepID=A0AAN8V4U3_9MAGN